MPGSLRRATSRPTAPSPPNPTLRASRAISSFRTKVSSPPWQPAAWPGTFCLYAPVGRGATGHPLGGPMAKREFMTNINPNTFTTRPEIAGTFGVVTTTHWIATAGGMGILERGGNAFDAAVATAFTLPVMEPHLCRPGGDVPLILPDAKRGRTRVICRQGSLPANAT